MDGKLLMLFSKNQYFNMEEIEKLKKQINVLEQRLQLYEQDGTAKLYYSLSRKMVEMANLLNNTSLSTLPLDDPKDKTFERLKILWNDSANLAAAVKSLGESAGVTGDEKKDTVKKSSFLDRVAI